MADSRQVSRRRMLLRTGDRAARGDGVRGVGDHGEVLTGTENLIAIIFWMLVLQSILGLVPALAVWRWPAADAWPWIIMVAFGGTFSHDCSARALRHADAAVVVPMDFIRVPLTALAGWWLYAERFTMWAVLGAPLIPAGNLNNVLRQRAVMRAPSPDTPRSTYGDLCRGKSASALTVGVPSPSASPAFYQPLN